jgi:isopentenyl-diphosphate delta-isomerase
MKQRDSVVLVDIYGRDLFNQDGELSIMDKIEAHYRGLLHKAVSVFIFNDRNEILLQRRAAGKYHSPNKWTNTCCTHPLPGETPFGTAQRRLSEEMGLVAALTEVFTFSYQADVGNGLIENEFDHVFFGVLNQNPNPNPAEVSDWDWVTIENLKQELIRNPQNYSLWLRRCFNEVVNHRSLKSKCGNT